MKNNLEDEIEAYYINESKKIPQLSDGQKNILKERIYDNKHKRKSFIKNQFAIIASLLIVILIPSILIPVLNNNQVKYYTFLDPLATNMGIPEQSDQSGTNLMLYRSYGDRVFRLLPTMSNEPSIAYRQRKQHHKSVATFHCLNPRANKHQQLSST